MNYFSYFSEIEETFVRRRGKNLLLSPLDWALIEAWKERGVPLYVVLRAIENVFENADRNPARKRSIKSLVYCRDEVENQFAVWQETQIGNLPEEPESNGNNQLSLPRELVMQHLQKIKEVLQKPHGDLNGIWQNFSVAALPLLLTAEKDFAANEDLESLQSVLSSFDYQIDETVLPQVFSDANLSAVKSETTAQIQKHRSRMSAAVYSETFKNLLIKNLRNRIDLPRFSLFYL